MSNKKVLIITYYWPPSGGSGVQRWLKFVKYLPQFGVEPHIYTPLNPDFNVKDDSLLKDIPEEAIIIKRKIIEPYALHRFLVGKKSAEGSNFGMTNKKKSFVSNTSMWVRSNFFIPDPRVLWVKPSVKFLKKYIIENNIEKIITTGPPHSMHLIGLRLKKSFGDKIEWIADFRDPWTQVFYKDELKINKRTDKILQKIEKRVLNSCDKLITVSSFLQKEFDTLGAKGKSIVIPNGYDDIDYKLEDNTKDNNHTKKFTISYIGLLPKSSNPYKLWKVLSDKVKTDSQFSSDFELVFVGNIDPIIHVVIEELGLSEFASFKGVVTHQKAIQYQKEADLLLLLIPNVPNSQGILTGKFFEYMASKTPIIAIGPIDGDVAQILKKTKAGDIVGFEDKDALFDIITQRYHDFLKGNIQASSDGYQEYSRKELTKKLVNFLFEKIE